MNKLRCANCNYRFFPKTERIPNRCPYCAENSLMEEASADSVVKDELCFED